jgi:cell division transport system permease protein
MHRLRYCCADAWDEWRHNPGVNLLALATLAATLFLAGVVLLLLSNLDRQVAELRRDIRVLVFLRDDLAPAQRAGLERELRALPGVVQVEHVDKQEALRRYQQWAGELGDLVGELETNPLPASLEVALAPGPDAERVAATLASRLEGRGGIEEVRFNRDWLERLESLLELARLGGAGLALLVFGTVVVIIACVLRLAAHSRRDEIEIMLLVGAPPALVRGPFLVAGFVQGLLASLLALGLVELVRRSSLAYAGPGSRALLDIAAGRPLAVALALALLGTGLVVSLAGSYFAVRASS